ncbi:MAG: hypothetical protein ACOX5G_08450 [Kiritimatiellia bacterium]
MKKCHGIKIFAASSISFAATAHAAPLRGGGQRLRPRRRLP